MFSFYVSINVSARKFDYFVGEDSFWANPPVKFGEPPPPFSDCSLKGLRLTALLLRN
jgi:hypothetical protein